MLRFTAWLYFSKLSQAWAFFAWLKIFKYSVSSLPCIIHTPTECRDKNQRNMVWSCLEWSLMLPTVFVCVVLYLVQVTGSSRWCWCLVLLRRTSNLPERHTRSCWFEWNTAGENGMEINFIDLCWNWICKHSWARVNCVK